ncbi:carbohydrate ABC transporter permease [Rhodopila sp.]|uniref:carbohydrate ABC transporter permease n=1 Tax=Rhodopila sp. TaxID=2480087 RepID=UPI003D099AD5
MSFLYSRRVAPWLLLTPALVLGTIFYAVPIASSFYLSLTDWNALDAAHWRGVSNYIVLLTADPLFMQSLVSTFLLAIGSAAVGIPAALFLALAVTASRHRAGWRTIFWLPAITNIVAVAYAWQIVLDPTYGIVNRLLAVVGIAGPDWLTQPGTAMLSLTLVMAWMTLGQNILLFSTGLEAIDQAVLEAARSDGANGRQILWHVTLPLLKPTTLFVLVSTLISGMGAFALILVMTEGGPDDGTMVTALYMYRMAFESLRIGRACAVAIILTVITLLLSVLQLRFFGRDSDASA